MIPVLAVSTLTLALLMTVVIWAGRPGTLKLEAKIGHAAQTKAAVATTGVCRTCGRRIHRCLFRYYGWAHNTSHGQ